MLSTTFLSDFAQLCLDEDADVLINYIDYKTPGKQSPRRLTLKNLIVEVDDLQLCSTMFGDTFYWFNLKSFLLDCKVDLDHFKALLEMHNLDLIALEELEEKIFCNNSSVCKQLLFNSKFSSAHPLRVLEQLASRYFNKRRRSYEASKITKEHHLVYRLSLLADLKGLKYFHNHLITNYSNPLLEVLVKELSLDSINPRMAKTIIGLGQRVPRLYTELVQNDSDFKVTEYYSIIENLFNVIGGV